MNFKGNKKKSYKTKARDTPGNSTTILDRDIEGAHHRANWHFQSIIGKLNFLEKPMRGELAYAVHQAARFSVDPRKAHTKHVHNIVRFLLATREEVLILDPGETIFKCWADADFCGLWNKDTAAEDPNTARS